MTSVPVMSDGMRSGVNWMRENPRLSVLATVEMRRVLAKPGTPTTRACPPHRITMSSSSITWSWPTMTLCTSAVICA